MGSGVSEGCSLTGCFIPILREEKLEKGENEIRVIVKSSKLHTFLPADSHVHLFLVLTSLDERICLRRLENLESRLIYELTRTSNGSLSSVLLRLTPAGSVHALACHVELNMHGEMP
jgi:hypothetical protein